MRIAHFKSAECVELQPCIFAVSTSQVSEGLLSKGITNLGLGSCSQVQLKQYDSEAAKYYPNMVLSK